MSTTRERLAGPRSRAENIVRATIGSYFTAGETIREFHELAQRGSAVDPLQEFSEAACEELRAFAPL
ncbi:hypothetical protein [Bradyrhizobium sp.]